jgi:hypothetical protein
MKALGDAVYSGGGAELLEMIRKARAGERLNLRGPRIGRALS